MLNRRNYNNNIDKDKRHIIKLDKIYNVLFDDIYSSVLIIGCAYIVGGYTVLPYFENTNPTSPGIYLLNNEMKIIYPSIDISHIYSVDNLIEINENDIHELIDDVGNKCNQEMFLNKTGDAYKLPIHEDDQPLMRVFKETLNVSGRDIEAYKHRFPSNDFNNVKRRLPQDRSLSINKFVQYCEAFDLDGQITCTDKYNKENTFTVYI